MNKLWNALRHFLLNEFLRIAARNLTRNIRRNVATATAISLGFSGFLLLGGYYNWITRLEDAFFIYGFPLGHVVIFRHDGTDKSITDPRRYALDAADQGALDKAISAIPLIEMHGAKLVGSGLITSGCDSFPFQAQGMDPTLNFKLRNHPNAVAIFGDLRHMIRGKQLYSVLSETESTAIMAPLTLLQRLYGNDHASHYMIWLHDQNRIDEAVAQLKSKLDNRADRYDFYRFDDENLSRFYTGSRRFINVLVSFIAGIMTILIALTIFNSSTITVIERAREIGMMRSLGFQRVQVRRLFMTEFLLLSICAVGVGALVGGASVFILNHAGIPYSPPGIGAPVTLRFMPSLAGIFFALGVVLAITAIATLAALRNVNQKKITALLDESYR